MRKPRGAARRWHASSSINTDSVPRWSAETLEENTAADGVELRADQIKRLNELTPAAGERHEAAQMSVVDR